MLLADVRDDFADCEDVKNHLILNTLDQKHTELDQAKRLQIAVRQ